VRDIEQLAPRASAILLLHLGNGFHYVLRHPSNIWCNPAQSHYGEAEIELQNLADALRRAEKLFGEREAAICCGSRLTYGGMAARCRRLAGGLQGLGVEPGDRVATLMVNCHRYLEAYFAVPGMAR
jgi:non-ribosomal peptide synthetase component E (peptide arylation enzyme)